MTTAPQRAPDLAWSAFAEMEDAEREPLMEQRFRAIAALGEDERREQLHAIAVAEYALANDKLKPLSKSRLRALLALDRDAAQRIAGSYDSVMRLMPADAAMRRVTIVQSLSTEFTPEEEAQLIDLLPNVFAGAPGRGGVSAAMTSVQGLGPRVEEKKASKPFWAFWKK